MAVVRIVPMPGPQGPAGLSSIDGGNASSVYLASQLIDGGSAGSF